MNRVAPHRGADLITAQPVSETVKRLLDLVRTSLEDDKAEDIISIDLKGKTTIADYMIVANGRSQRQVTAMADHLAERVKKAGFASCQVEGLPRADWVLIDAGDVIVHIFRPEVRAYYNLEKMWAVDLPDEAAVG